MPTGDVLALSRKDSFEVVVLPHLDAAHNLARWLMRDAEAAEDVLQDAIVRALTCFPTFKGINPRGWLLQIVRNAAYGSMNVSRGMQMVPIAISGGSRLRHAQRYSVGRRRSGSEPDQSARPVLCPATYCRFADRASRDPGAA